MPENVAQRIALFECRDLLRCPISNYRNTRSWWSAFWQMDIEPVPYRITENEPVQLRAGNAVSRTR